MCNIPPVVRQFLAIVCCNFLTTSVGMLDGWSSINFVDLKKENSTYSAGPLTTEQLALMMSISSIGGLFGNFAVAPISKAIGVKLTIHLLALPLMTCSLLIIWAQNVYFLYASRIINGMVTGALIVSVPILINGISNDNVRGALNSLYDPSYNIGVVVSYFLGSQLTLVDQAKTQLILPTIFLIIQFILHEPPEFYVKQNDGKRAMKSHKFYKGQSIDAESMKFLSKPTVEKGLDEPDDHIQKMSVWQQITALMKKFQSQQAKKAFFISFSLLILSGMFWIFPAYVTDIFDKTGSTLSEKNSSLLISITTLLTNLVFLNFVERFNRKTLYVGSSIVSAFGFIAFAAHCLVLSKDPKYDWIPLVCFIFIIFSSGMGLLPIPYIVIYEIFPKEILEISLAIAVSSIWILLGFLGYLFPVVLSSFGVSSVLITLAIMCVINVIFGIYILPETRGKSHEQIMELLRG